MQRSRVRMLTWGSWGFAARSLEPDQRAALGPAAGPADIQSWIATVAPYVKALAPNQLVTVGEDGFYQKSNCQSNTCALALWLFKDPGDLK